MEDLEKYRKLTAIAEADNVYQLWERCYRESVEAFTRYADSQPEEIKNLLWTYAESGRLMQQRKVNLACEHMEFLKK